MRLRHVLITALLFIAVLFCGITAVEASEDTPKSYTFSYEFLYEYDDEYYGEAVKDYYGTVYVNYTSTEYVLVLLQRDNDYGNSWNMCWYSPVSGSVIYYANGDKVPDGVTLESYGMKKRISGETESTEEMVSLYAGLVDRQYENATLLNVEDSAMYYYNSDDYVALGLGIYSGSIKPVLGFDIWNTGNRYDYESKYSASVVAPEIRNAYLYKNRGGDIGGLLIRFLLPGLEDNSDYYAELWADIPTGYDSNGNATYNKMCLGIYKASDILKINTVTSGSHNTTDPNDESADYDYTATYGSYYMIKETWSTLLPMISVDEAASYGGITFYLRSAQYLSDTLSLVSDYAYFKANPNDSKYPVIFNGNGQNFDEDGEGNNDEDTDPTTPNSDDVQYIGGTTDDPGISSDSSSGGDWNFNMSGEWTVTELEDFINSGFGLAGDNGLLSLIGNTFFFLPSEFVTILMFLIVVIAVVAIIRIVG